MEAKSSELSPPERLPGRHLRVLLDGRKIGDGGIGVYTQNLIEGLLEVGGIDLTVIHRAKEAPEIRCANGVTWLCDAARPYSVDEMLLMPRRIDFSQFDLFHTPHYVLPFGIPIPSVITVHDLIHISHPERFFYPPIARSLIRSSVRRADGVLAVSRHTRAEVLKLTGADEAKVRVVPNAISKRILSNNNLGDQKGIVRPYIFALFSNNKPHKGLGDLIAAYRTFKNSELWRGVLSSPPELVLGGYGVASLMTHRAQRAAFGDVEGVRVVGALSDEDLRISVRGAEALVVPSLVEGFCLPALEAQVCGTPVVCRPVPALQELVTERDTVAHDFSVLALAEAMASGLRKASTAPRTVAQSHLDLFSSQRTAMMVKSEYERVVNERASQ